MIQPLEEKEWYKKCCEFVDRRILELTDSKGIYYGDNVDEKHLNYVLKNAIGYPFFQHMMLACFVISQLNLEVKTKGGIISRNTKVLKELFEYYHINDVANFNPDFHIYNYMKKGILPEHTDSKRNEFFNCYISLTTKMKKWFEISLSKEQKIEFRSYLLPTPSFSTREFSVSKSAKAQAQRKRKEEVDSIAGDYLGIRAEARFRLNQMRRLKNAYQETIAHVEKNELSLPFDFSYTENETRTELDSEQWHFRLWDKVSFELHRNGSINPYAKKTNGYFVEFVYAENKNTRTESEGLWFLPILENGVIGNWIRSRILDERLIRSKVEFLASYGFVSEKKGAFSTPFFSQHKGILSPDSFVTNNQNQVDGVLLDIETFYIATLFGALAIEIFTITGARLNELFQIKLTKECMVQLSNRETGRDSYVFYLIPKGRDETEAFYVSEDTFDLVQELVLFLKDEHYHDSIPKVKFNYRHRISDLFKEEKYIFQYQHNLLSVQALYSCMNFVCFGLTYQTKTGTIVKIKPHLLRHGFATHAVQGEKMPIDIVKQLMHQKNVEITEYYSQPTQSQIQQQVDELHTSMATKIDLMEEIVRQPEELQRQLEEYAEKVGVYNKTVGGDCTTDRVCPHRMACIGCAAKVPNPDYKHELIEHLEWAEANKEYFEKKGHMLEANKMKKTIHDGKVELKEMELIRQFREDASHGTDITFASKKE